MTIKIIVCGAGGRMGGRIIACARSEPDLAIVGAVDRPGHPDLGRDAGELSGAGKLDCLLTDSLPAVIERGDVVIDFSAPEAAAENAACASAGGKSLVVGTTGISPEGEKQLRSAAAGIACVYSPNMSVGVNLLFRLVGETAEALGDAYDVEIVEVHHRLKKDAPSGTAKKIAEIAAGALHRDPAEASVYGREGLVGERTREEIGIHAVRAGDIVGEHTVIFSAPGERLELIHRAHSRDTFARGALRAARFAAAAGPGFYSMRDVLGI